MAKIVFVSNPLSQDHVVQDLLQLQSPSRGPMKRNEVGMGWGVFLLINRLNVLALKKCMCVFIQSKPVDVLSTLLGGGLT